MRSKQSFVKVGSEGGTPVAIFRKSIANKVMGATIKTISYVFDDMLAPKLDMLRPGDVCYVESEIAESGPTSMKLVSIQI